ncbi:MAG: hypothetical protein ABIF82_01620, partial [Planctomycetota bacterium]
TQGPIEFGANCDGYIVEHCEAFTGLNYSFDLICAVNAGAAGEMIENVTDRGDLTAAVTSVGTAATSVGTAVGSLHTVTDAAVASLHTVTDAAVASLHTVTDTGVTSVGTAAGSLHTVTDAAVASLHTVTDAAVASLHTVTDTGVTSVGTAVTGPGRALHFTKTISDDSIPSNAQSFALFTATGDVLIEEIIFSKDGTALAAMTNIELSCNNAFGLTGLANDLFVNVVGGLAGNLTLRATDGGVTPWVPRVLENTKILYMHGSDAAGNSGGQIKVTAIAYGLTAGASLA